MFELAQRLARTESTIERRLTCIAMENFSDLYIASGSSHGTIAVSPDAVVVSSSDEGAGPRSKGDCDSDSSGPQIGSHFVDSSDEEEYEITAISKSTDTVRAVVASTMKPHSSPSKREWERIYAKSHLRRAAPRESLHALRKQQDPDDTESECGDSSDSDDTPAVISPPFIVGSRIEGRRGQGEDWFPGVLTLVGKKTCSIKYNDGDTEVRQLVCLSISAVRCTLHQLPPSWLVPDRRPHCPSPFQGRWTY